MVSICSVFHVYRLSSSKWIMINVFIYLFSMNFVIFYYYPLDKIDFNAKMSCFAVDPSFYKQVRLTRKLLVLSKRFQFPKRKCFLWVRYFSECVKPETYKRMLLYQMLLTHLIRFFQRKKWLSIWVQQLWFIMGFLFRLSYRYDNC